VFPLTSPVVMAPFNGHAITGALLSRYSDVLVIRGGAMIALVGITILHFQDSRVVERFSQADMLGLLVRIGAVPAPA